MLPREIIDSFTAPDGNEFRLVRHDRDLYIELDGAELMSTRRTGSEVRLAELGCERLGKEKAPRVLVGGLGFGFTARAVLKQLPPGGRVTVAELFPQVVEWNRKHASHLYGNAFEDRRLQIEVGDVWALIGRGGWDAILLDTDNGPDAACLDRNDRLYGRNGLERLRAGLKENGRLAIWSADAVQRFVKSMGRAGFDARCITVRERGSKGSSYAVFLGDLGKAGRPAEVGRGARRPTKASRGSRSRRPKRR